MHEPGPPRFVAVGEGVELAPRNPDPCASYEWQLRTSPAESTVTVDGDPVEHLTPDRPGVYELELDAPDGTHRQRVRAFPNARETVRFEVAVGELPDHDPADVYVVGPWNEWAVGDNQPERRDEAYVHEIALPPGDHDAVFLVDDDFENGVRVSESVEGPERPRVRLDANLDGDDVVFEADPRAGPSSPRTPEDLAVEFYVDDRDAFTGNLRIDGHEARCSLDQIEGAVCVHTVAVDERHSVADAVLVDADADDTGDDRVTVERLNEPPEWVEGATMYEIFVRSFVGDAGTTFDRLTERVSYLDWLGVDVVWLTPILESLSPILGDDAPGGPHGYDVLDYFEVAADLGTRVEFESFVETCHDANIRVVFDLVVNHTSIDHRAHQLSAAGVDEYREWYVWEDADDAVVPDELRERHARDVESVPRHYFNWRGLPNLNYDSLAVREHVLSVVEEWAGVVDGFRCDVAWGVDHGVWKEVHDRVRAEHEEFFLLDETIPRDPDFGECEFDAHYDTTLYHALRDVGTGDQPATRVVESIRAREREGFPPDSVQMRYVENHDEDRYIGECGRNELRAAAGATFTLPGLPMIYYGQESGLDECRGDMNWTTGDEALRRFHRQLVSARDALPVLVDGGVEQVDVDVQTGSPDRVVAYARSSATDRVVVVLHFGNGSATVRIPERVESVALESVELTETRIDEDGTSVTVDSVAILSRV